MDIHSHIYLLINDKAHTIALYSTGKCNGVPCNVSFISRYMCECTLKNKKNVICFLAESYKNKNKKISSIFFHVLFLYDMARI